MTWPFGLGACLRLLCGTAKLQYDPGSKKAPQYGATKGLSEARGKKAYVLTLFEFCTWWLRPVALVSFANA
jgi:hypothetical protein